MRKLAELRLIILIAVILGVIALLGKAAAPSGIDRDPRLSTRLTGPYGAKAFRTALGRLGVDVTERRTPFFDLGRGAAPDPRVMLAILAPIGRLTTPERRAVRDWVVRGGHLLAVGGPGLAECFGYTRVVTDTSVRNPWRNEMDTIALRPDQIPAPRAVFKRYIPDTDDADDAATRRARECAPKDPASIERLWVASKDPSALRLDFPSGGRVILVADAGIFSNRVMRWTDGGVMAIEWVLADHPRAMIVDEYHQGFGRSSSLPGAVLSRTGRTPVGWALIQLLAAGLLLLVLGAVRFGPAVSVIQRRRRSPLEHLDALASGLERSRASRTAVGLIVGGLRRRLGALPGRSGDSIAWLESLEAGTRTPASRNAIQQLRRAARAEPAGADVMRAANAVEDVWETFKVPTRTRS